MPKWYQRFRSYFKHVQPHEDLAPLRKYILGTLLLTTLTYSLTAPLKTSMLVVFVFFISLIINSFKLSVPTLVTYILGALLVSGMRLSFSTGSAYAEILATSVILLTLARSFKLHTYKDGETVLIYLLFTNACILLFDSSLTLMFIFSFNILMIVGQILRLQLKNFTLSMILTSMKGAMRVAVYSLPLMIMFVWLFNQSKNNRGEGFQRYGTTGVSRSMDPGQFSRIAKNHSVAFRISTDRPLPEVPLYWRVTSLDISAGLHWHRSVREPFKVIPDIKKGGCVFEQHIFKQDPLDVDQSLALDFPLKEFKSESSDYFAFSNLCQFQSQKSLSSEDIKHFLKTPAWPDPDLLKLLESLGSKSQPSKVVDQISRFFRTGGFKYSLDSEKSGRYDFLDFLFERKQGYCEHFAGSAATLLRLKGIPARVVVGYAGGEYNAIGNYWALTYADAHAWVEYWDGESWNRYDPTSIVTYGRSTEKDLTEKILSHPLLKKTWLALDTLSFAAQKTFLGREQVISLQDLTYDPWIAMGSLLILFLVFRLRHLAQSKMAKINSEFRDLCEIFEHRGLPRRRNQGFESYRQALISDPKFSSFKDQIDKVFNEYLQLRYFKNEQEEIDVQNLLYDIRQTRKALKKTA